jgi:hypothetical protein
MTTWCRARALHDLSNLQLLATAMLLHGTGEFVREETWRAVLHALSARLIHHV